MTTQTIAALVLVALSLVGCTESAVQCMPSDPSPQGVYDGVTGVTIIGGAPPEAISIWDEATVIVEDRDVSIGLNLDRCRITVVMDALGDFDGEPQVDGMCTVGAFDFVPKRAVGHFGDGSYFVTVIGHLGEQAITIRSSGVFLHD